MFTGGGYLGKAAAAAVVASLLTFGGLAYSPVMAADNTTVTDSNGNEVTNTDPKNEDINANITGKKNKVTDSNNAEIVGDKNTVTNEVKDENGNVVTKVRSDDARIVGSDNTISGSRNQQVIGDHNTIIGRDKGTVTDYGHPEGRDLSVADITIGRENTIHSGDTYRNEWDSLTVIGNHNIADSKLVDSAGGPASGIVVGSNQNIDGIEESIVIGSLSPAEQNEKTDNPNHHDKYTVGRNSIILGNHASNTMGESIVVGNRSQGNGEFQTIMGHRSVIQGYADQSEANHIAENYGALSSIYGAFNTIESARPVFEDSSNDDPYFKAVDGFGNSINGTLNKTSSARGTMIMGAANTVTHSQPDIIKANVFGTDDSMDDVWLQDVTSAVQYYNLGDDNNLFNLSYDDAIAAMKAYATNASGAVSVLGNGNAADYAIRSQILGTANTLTGNQNKISANNTINGYGNTGTNITHSAVVGSNNTLSNGEDNVVIGDYHNMDGGKHNVVLGSMKSKEQTSQKEYKSPVWQDVKYNVTEQVPVKDHKNDIENAVMVGYNTDVTENGGVALGSDSIASTEAEKIGYNANGKKHAKSDKDYATWVSTDAAVSVGGADREVTYDVLDKDGKPVKDDNGKTKQATQIVKSTRQITNLAAGTEDTDAVNVAQLKASKTKYYSVNDSAPGAIFDNEEFEKYYTNKNSDGAKSYYAMAAGYGTYAAGDASTVIGSYSVIQNDKVKGGDDEDLSPQGATAVSVGSFNFNLNTPIKSANDFSKWYSGTANSIVGQGNLTKDSNGVLIYGAGNKITNSYRGDVPINMLVNSMNPDVYQNPESFMDKVGEAVLQSGGQVMAIGGGNVADKAYMTQLMGVGNKVQGADITFTPPELQDDEENYERYITAFNSAFNKQATRLNYVDGFYNNLTNAKNDYVIGMANAISGDDVSSNKSNIVIGDFHQMKNGSNNIILGSQDGELTQKRYNTDGTLVTEESINRFTHQENLEDAVMIGHNTDVQKNGGVALGAESVASVDKDVVGYDPSGIDHGEDKTGVWKSTRAAASVGDASKNITRQITNVAAGKELTDAVNVAQLKSAQIHYYSMKVTQESAEGDKSNYNNDGATGEGSIAIGPFASAKGNHSLALGYNAETTHLEGEDDQDDNTAVGYKSQAGYRSTALGYMSQATGGRAVALGGRGSG